MAGIVGYGVYIPRYRIAKKEVGTPWGNSAPGEKAVCGGDEDVVTMAAEAMVNAINHSDIDPTEIEAIYIGTASSPYIEQQIAPTLAAKRIKCGIVVGCEDRATAPGTEGDVHFGAGAIAMVIGTHGTIADFEGIHTYSTLFMDRWHATGDKWGSNWYDYRFDREYGYQKHVIEAFRGVIQKVGKKAAP